MIDESFYNSGNRPYFSGVTENDDNIATIVLQIDHSANSTSNLEPKTYNYLTQFTNYVATVRSGGSTAATNDLSTALNADIPNLVLDGVHDYYGVFNNFSLEAVQEQSADIVKITQNFSGFWNAFFMGEQPKMYTFRGHFIDTKDYPHYQTFMTAYNKYLAGRNSVKNKVKVKILYDGKIIEGYMLQVSTTSDANVPNLKLFTFIVLVKNEDWMRVNYINTDNGPAEGLNYLCNIDTVNSNSPATIATISDGNTPVINAANGPSSQTRDAMSGEIA